jgi:hypothetical protein
MLLINKSKHAPLMIPHYTNPHLLPQRCEIVSRADLYAEDGTTRTVDDSGYLQHSQCLFEQTLPSRSYFADDGPSQSSNMKCSKLEANKPILEGTIRA